MANLKRAIALGFFDGVHLGHGALLNKTKERAAQIGGMPSVLSFDVHPDTLVFNKSVPLINSSIGREEIIKRCYGIDNVVFLHFNRHMMEMPWREFIEALVQELNIGWIIVGYDFCFGYKGEGTSERLKEYCLENSIGCDIIPALKVDDIVVSSTYIRSLIADGDMERANKFLGHPHTLTDTVHSGYHLGSKLGSPTINMFFPEDVIVPKYGVYATKVYINDERECYQAVTNVGVRPTVGENSRANVESNLLDYSGNLYGRQARIEFYKFLRPEIKFESMQQLSMQIRQDAQMAKEYLDSL